MVERHIAHRGITSPLVLAAMRTVPRELFLPQDLQQSAYDDTPLPIEAGQTISQPYIVALMAEALLLHGDGTLGWSEHAPFDAIVVAAGGPEVPASLKSQLKPGGRLVIPVGADRRLQKLLRITRLSEHEYQTEELADVRFVPLVGAEGWAPTRSDETVPARRASPLATSESDVALARSIAASAEAFTSIDTADLEPLLRQIGAARVVLLGEATHGTSEFYQMRDRILRALIQRKGFSFIAIEGDWPDDLYSLYSAIRASWNLRDRHMFDTLTNLLKFHGPDSKGIVWAHNSHVGDSAATEMSGRGEYNIGHLCREQFGESAYLIGFGTPSGTVAAASEWQGPMRDVYVWFDHTKALSPLPDTYPFDL